MSLFLAGCFFVVIHLGVAGTKLRDRIVAATGPGAYTGAFSLLSLAGVVWLVVAYNGAEFEPLWPQGDWSKLLADVLMLPAFVLVVAGLLTPNPTAVGAEARASQPPQGIVRVTRHPFLVGVALWAALHVLANGDLASLLFFGAFLVTAGAGPASIDAKRRRALGPASWDPFAAQTSVLPFAAILSGRTQPEFGRAGWWRIGAGALAYLLFIGGHRHIVGVSPFPGF